MSWSFGFPTGDDGARTTAARLAQGRSAAAETSALVAAMFAALLTGQTLIEILNKAERRIWWIEPDAILRMLTYALGIFLVVRVGS